MSSLDQMNSEEIIAAAITSIDQQIRSKIAARNVLQQRLRHIQTLSQEVPLREYKKLQQLPESKLQMEMLTEVKSEELSTASKRS
jgi:hypothetical protein